MDYSLRYAVSCNIFKCYKQSRYAIYHHLQERSTGKTGMSKKPAQRFLVCLGPACDALGIHLAYIHDA